MQRFSNFKNCICYNLPNLKGRVPVGVNSSDTDFNSLGKTGGEKRHKLVTNEMPLVDGGLFYHSNSTSQWSLTSNVDGRVQELNTNINNAHNNLQHI